MDSEHFENSLSEVQEKLSMLQLDESKHKKETRNLNTNLISGAPWDGKTQQSNDKEIKVNLDRKRKRGYLPKNKVHEKSKTKDVKNMGNVQNLVDKINYKNTGDFEAIKPQKSVNKQIISETRRKKIVPKFASRIKMEVTINENSFWEKMNEEKKPSPIKPKNAEDTGMTLEEVQNILNLLKEMEIKKKANILNKTAVLKVTKKSRIEPPIDWMFTEKYDS